MKNIRLGSGQYDTFEVDVCITLIIKVNNKLPYTSESLAIMRRIAGDCIRSALNIDKIEQSNQIKEVKATYCDRLRTSRDEDEEAETVEERGSGSLTQEITTEGSASTEGQ